MTVQTSVVGAQGLPSLPPFSFRPNSLAKTQQTQFILGSPIPHIRHHHSSISKGISHYRQSLYLVGGLSQLARKARRAARRAPAASWPVAMIPFLGTTLRVSGPLELALSERDDFVDLQQRIPPFSCCFSGLNGDRKGNIASAKGVAAPPRQLPLRECEQLIERINPR
jgi:hypothetical protein